MAGLDNKIIQELNSELALQRIKNDLQSDFIFAPHLNVIFYLAGPDLWERLVSKLKSGDFEPALPIMLEVPKASGFSRPGSILGPFERLIYQASVDMIAPAAESALNREQVFSYALLGEDPNGFMFESASDCFTKFKEKVIEYCQSGDYTHVLKADVASFFERLYQHVLINLLNSAGCNNYIVSFLEKFMALLTQKDSHGIIQGVFPSDFLGNFYLCSLDAEHQINDIPFVRYVDDIYMFFKSEKDVNKHKIRLSTWLRRDGLNLNEAKTKTFAVEDLVREETEVELMFEDAKEEAWSELSREDFYTSTISWDFLFDEDQDEEIDEKDIELVATKKLFDLEDVNSETKNKIVKFCLPIFTAALDEHAIAYVLKIFPLSMHMAQPFATYLNKFVRNNQEIANSVEALLGNENVFYEYQYMWLYAALMRADKVSSDSVKFAINQLRNTQHSEALRATCAVFVGKFGNVTQRRILKTHYTQEPSSYVRSAILHSSRHFPKNEKETCFTAWSGHNEVNSLIVSALKKLG